MRSAPGHLSPCAQGQSVQLRLWVGPRLLTGLEDKATELPPTRVAVGADGCVLVLQWKTSVFLGLGEPPLPPRAISLVHGHLSSPCAAPDSSDASDMDLPLFCGTQLLNLCRLQSDRVFLHANEGTGGFWWPQDGDWSPRGGERSWRLSLIISGQ